MININGYDLDWCTDRCFISTGPCDFLGDNFTYSSGQSINAEHALNPNKWTGYGDWVMVSGRAFAKNNTAHLEFKYPYPVLSTYGNDFMYGVLGYRIKDGETFTFHFGDIDVEATMSGMTQYLIMRKDGDLRDKSSILNYATDVKASLYFVGSPERFTIYTSDGTTLQTPTGPGSRPTFSLDYYTTNSVGEYARLDFFAFTKPNVSGVNSSTLALSTTTCITDAQTCYGWKYGNFPKAVAVSIGGIEPGLATPCALCGAGSELTNSVWGFNWWRTPSAMCVQSDGNIEIRHGTYGGFFHCCDAPGSPKAVPNSTTVQNIDGAVREIKYSYDAELYDAGSTMCDSFYTLTMDGHWGIFTGPWPTIAMPTSDTGIQAATEDFIDYYWSVVFSQPNVTGEYGAYQLRLKCDGTLEHIQKGVDIPASDCGILLGEYRTALASGGTFYNYNGIISNNSSELCSGPIADSVHVDTIQWFRPVGTCQQPSNTLAMSQCNDCSTANGTFILPNSILHENEVNPITGRIYLDDRCGAYRYLLSSEVPCNTGETTYANLTFLCDGRPPGTSDDYSFNTAGEITLNVTHGYGGYTTGRIGNHGFTSAPTLEASYNSGTLTATVSITTDEYYVDGVRFPPTSASVDIPGGYGKWCGIRVTSSGTFTPVSYTLNPTYFNKYDIAQVLIGFKNHTVFSHYWKYFKPKESENGIILNNTNIMYTGVPGSTGIIYDFDITTRTMNMSCIPSWFNWTVQVDGLRSVRTSSTCTIPNNVTGLIYMYYDRYGVVQYDNDLRGFNGSKQPVVGILKDEPYASYVDYFSSNEACNCDVFVGVTPRVYGFTNLDDTSMIFIPGEGDTCQTCRNLIITPNNEEDYIKVAGPLYAEQKAIQTVLPRPSGSYTKYFVSLSTFPGQHFQIDGPFYSPVVNVYLSGVNGSPTYSGFPIAEITYNSGDWTVVDTRVERNVCGIHSWDKPKGYKDSHSPYTIEINPLNGEVTVRPAIEYGYSYFDVYVGGIKYRKTEPEIIEVTPLLPSSVLSNDFTYPKRWNSVRTVHLYYDTAGTLSTGTYMETSYTRTKLCAVTLGRNIYYRASTKVISDVEPYDDKNMNETLYRAGNPVYEACYPGNSTCQVQTVVW